MCYLMGHEHAGEESEGTTPPKARRWMGAAVLTLIGGMAAASFVSPSIQQDTRPAAASAPTAVPTAASTPAAFIQQGSMTVDDDVPTAPGVTKAAMGHCEHGI